MKFDEKVIQELKALKKMSDKDIDYSDIPEVKSMAGWKQNPFFNQLKHILDKFNK